jgi:hypothetical protein
MTFVLNVLHNGYSLLAADRQANTEVTTTITNGNIIITLKRALELMASTR